MATKDDSRHPKVVVLAGPNGAGKTTLSTDTLRGFFRVDEFVNADRIAEGLSAFAPEHAAIEAARIMLTRLNELAELRVDFAFETTLASRSLAPWIKALKQSGYEFHLIFVWLPSPEFAIDRVARRVASGGHNVPPDTVRRRYFAGIRNFFDLYQPLAATWRLVHNGSSRVLLVAAGSFTQIETIDDSMAWQSFREVYHEGRRS